MFYLKRLNYIVIYGGGFSAGFTIVVRCAGPRCTGGPSSCQINFITMDFCLCGAILNWMALFRSDSSHNDRVYCLCRPTVSTSFRAQVKDIIA